MPKKKSAPKAGRLSMADMRALVNKKAGQEVAHDLKESNPTEVHSGFQLVVVGWILLFVAVVLLGYQ